MVFGMMEMASSRTPSPATKSARLTRQPEKGGKPQISTRGPRSLKHLGRRLGGNYSSTGARKTQLRIRGAETGLEMASLVCLASPQRAWKSSVPPSLSLPFSLSSPAPP